MEQSSEWHYTDTGTGVQKGPVPAVVLLRLLEKGVGVNGQTLVEPFASVIKFQSQQWYYVDMDGVQHGPIPSKLLVHKLKEGDIDGLTLVYGGDVTEWKKVSEVQVLKDEMGKIAEDEERARLAFLRSQEDSGEAQHQVFVDDDDPRKAYELAFAAVKPPESADLVGDGSDLKTYIADNGQRYVWDEEENDWVEADDEEAATGTDAGNSGSNNKAAAAATGKRKAGGEAHHDGDEDSGDDAENGGEHVKAGTGDATADNNKPKKRRTKKKAKKGPNTWVYVTGLPADITAEEIKDHFSKVGLIALSPYDQQPKIKIYREQPAPGAGAVDPNTLPCKGDCLICYNAEESVKLALDVLSGGYIRANAQVTVTRADFTPGGNGDQGNAGNANGGAGGDQRRKPALSQAQVKVARSAIKQALTWNEDDDIGVAKAAALRIVVLEGLFKPSDFDDPGFSEELEGDLASECEKCGTIEKITLFSSNPRGIAVVKFSTSYAAQECIRLMNGRYFAGSKLKCFFWDGVTNYSITAASERAAEEEEQAEAARLDEFGDWLEKDQEDLPEEFRLRTE